MTRINVNGKSTSDKKSIPNAFCSFFTNVGSSLESLLSKLPINTCLKVCHPSTNAESLNPDGKVSNFSVVSPSDVLKV